MPRFSILVHSAGPKFHRRNGNDGAEIAVGPTHWDWLFQENGEQRPLWTWATDPLVTLDSAKAISFPTGRTAALRLADHREQYLDYEGLISGGRGSVEQIATGHYHRIRRTPIGLRLQLSITGSNYFAHPTRLIVQWEQGQGQSPQGSPMWTLTIEDQSPDVDSDSSIASL